MLASALTAAMLLFVEHVRERPSPEQQAAIAALLQVEPGTIGAVVVTRNGVPEVIATVRSREEYLELASSGNLPEDHCLYLPMDA